MKKILFILFMIQYTFAVEQSSLIHVPWQELNTKQWTYQPYQSYDKNRNIKNTFKVILGVASLATGITSLYYVKEAYDAQKEQFDIQKEYDSAPANAKFGNYKERFELAGDRVEQNAQSAVLFGAVSGVLGLGFIFTVVQF